jgi:hypothetical protein
LRYFGISCGAIFEILGWLAGPALAHLEGRALSLFISTDKLSNCNAFVREWCPSFPFTVHMNYDGAMT